MKTTNGRTISEYLKRAFFSQKKMHKMQTEKRSAIKIGEKEKSTACVYELTSVFCFFESVYL